MHTNIPKTKNGPRTDIGPHATLTKPRGAMSKKFPGPPLFEAQPKKGAKNHKNRNLYARPIPHRWGCSSERWGLECNSVGLTG